jgi:hypothetical protein
MLNFSLSMKLALAVLLSAVLVSSLVSADQLTDELSEQLLDGVAELESKPERGRPILLISQSELDALPLDTAVSWSQKPTSPEGPIINIESPIHNGTYEGPFPILVEFEPGSKGYEVDISSLKLEYKKAWGIDITDRVREFITGTKIDVRESELPTGRHTVEIEIADTAKNLSRQIFTVTVK